MIDVGEEVEQGVVHIARGDARIPRLRIWSGRLLGHLKMPPCLARCLSNYSDPAMAFRVTNGSANARTTSVTRISRQLRYDRPNGKNPRSFWFRNTLLRLGSGKAATRGYVNFCQLRSV